MVDGVGIGIIGAGIMGSVHARVYHEISGARLVAVADLVEEKARTVASRYPGTAAVQDYHRLLDNPDIHAVHVATPDFAHREPVMDALRAGKHVLVEKPMATTVPEAEEIVELSRRTGRHVQVNYTHRWAAPYAEAHRVISAGQIGKPVMVYARKNDAVWAATEMMDWTAKTSSASYLSTHDIDLVLWFLDTDVRSVYAQGVRGVLERRGIDTEDAIQALVRFGNGGIGTFESSWILPNSMPTTTDSFIEVVGEKGTIHIDRIHEGLKVATEDGYRYPKLSLNLEIDGALHGGIRSSLESFVGAIREGTAPQPDASWGLRIVRVSAAIQESLKRGNPVVLGESV